MPPKQNTGVDGTVLRSLGGGLRIPAQDTATSRAERYASRSNRAASVDPGREEATARQQADTAMTTGLTTPIPASGLLAPRLLTPPQVQDDSSSTSSEAASSNPPQTGRITRSRSRDQSTSSEIRSSSSPSVGQATHTAASPRNRMGALPTRRPPTTSIEAWMRGEGPLEVHFGPGSTASANVNTNMQEQMSSPSSHKSNAGSASSSSSSQSEDSSQSSESVQDANEMITASDEISDSESDHPEENRNSPLYWLLMFCWYFWWYARHGLWWPSRQPRVFVSATVIASLLLSAMLCSAGPICQFHSPIYLLYIYARESLQEFVAIWTIYVLSILGFWNAFEGAVQVIGNTGIRQARLPTEMTIWGFPVDPWLYLRTNLATLGFDIANMVIKPLLLISLTLSFKGFIPVGTSPLRAFYAALLLHITKWCCQGLDATLSARHLTQRRSQVVFWTLFGLMTSVMLYQNKEIFSPQRYRDMARAFRHGEGYPRYGNETVMDFAGETRNRDQSALRQVYVVTVKTVTGGIGPTFPGYRIHDPSSICQRTVDGGSTTMG